MQWEEDRDASVCRRESLTANNYRAQNVNDAKIEKLNLGDPGENRTLL